MKIEDKAKEIDLKERFNLPSVDFELQNAVDMFKDKFMSPKTIYLAKLEDVLQKVAVVTAELQNYGFIEYSRILREIEFKIRDWISDNKKDETAKKVLANKIEEFKIKRTPEKKE